eukprot:scaffold163915_cov23-Cyclotella_meneghiniana.AAC.2
MVMLANYYSKGKHGLPVDQSKAFELLQRACELGSASGHFNLALSYDDGVGVKQDKKRAIHHYQIAAIMGHVGARNNLACTEVENGNIQRATKHFMIAAKCGYEDSLNNIKQGFRDGLVTKEDFEKTLRGHQAACNETKSEQRDRAAVIKARARE